MIPLLKDSPQQQPRKPILKNRRLADTKADQEAIEELKNEQLRKVSYVFLFVMLVLCVFCLVVGILYLTIYFYRYSFVQYSTIITASMFVSLCATLAIMGVISWLLVRANRHQMTMLTAGVAFIFFTTMLGIGIWGKISVH